MVSCNTGQQPTTESRASPNVQSLNIIANLGPIPPGSSFTYTFRASSYGTTWYHSHFSLQYSNGLIGPLVVNGPSSANWDIDLGPLGVTDYYHTPAFTLYYAERSHPGSADNALFNGLNTWNSTPTGPVVGQKYEMKFTPGKKHRIRLINMSTDSHFKFSIDQHVMTVQAADFVAIEPYQTTVLNIFIGNTPIHSLTANKRATIRYHRRGRSRR
jgi:FtsP/CotA-like multicopper oxidase with cupredoxin domain